jgi:hypothetical protein
VLQSAFGKATSTRPPSAAFATVVRGLLGRRTAVQQFWMIRQRRPKGQRRRREVRLSSLELGGHLPALPSLIRSGVPRRAGAAICAALPCGCGGLRTPATLKENVARLALKETDMLNHKPVEVSLADWIRQEANERYVAPLRGTPDCRIRIRAGDVHKALGLNGRYPAVCDALGSKIFEREFGLELVERTGPQHGANVVFVFKFRTTEAPTVRVDRNPSGPAPVGAYSESHEEASTPRPETPRQKFTLGGQRFEKQKRDFINGVGATKPGRVRKYSILIAGDQYPIRQVVSSATGLPAIAITSQEAFRILSKFGFTIDIHE